MPAPSLDFLQPQVNVSASPYQRTLYQFPFSPFCEKARWCLDHKQLLYVAKNRLPLLHRPITWQQTGQSRLPVLTDSGRTIADSSAIALYLEQQYPEHALFYHAQQADHQQLNQQIRQIDALSQQLGRLVKAWLYQTAFIPEYADAVQIVIGESGLLRRFERISQPILRRTLQRYASQQLGAAQLSDPFNAYLDQISQQFNQQDSGYLVGPRLTLADIAIASMLAPMVMPPETPWQGIQPIPDHDPVYQLLHRRGLDEYVLRLYREHRHARIDWRGI